jgi:hypothetical protein
VGEGVALGAWGPRPVAEAGSDLRGAGDDRLGGVGLEAQWLEDGYSTVEEGGDVGGGGDGDGDVVMVGALGEGRAELGGAR